MTNLENIINIINDSNNINITSVLSQDENEYLLKLFNKHDSILLELNNLTNEIVLDNKIDYHDIPNIILYISKLYISYFYINKNIDNYNIIEILYEIIIFTNLKDISTEEIIIINKILDISIELLKTNPTKIKNKIKYCCSRWRFAE